MEYDTTSKKESMTQPRGKGPWHNLGGRVHEILSSCLWSDPVGARRRRAEALRRRAPPGRVVWRSCCAAAQNIWLGLWDNACERGVLTLSTCFFVLFSWDWPADYGWISSYDCARHTAVRRYVWPSSFQEACTSMVHGGYDYVTPTRPADVRSYLFSARDTQCEWQHWGCGAAGTFTKYHNYSIWFMRGM